MKTILGNFARVAQDKGRFPMDANTLEKLQENTALLAVLGAALGKRAVILTGCEKNGNRRTEGYVYVKLTDTGEVLYFPGGDYTETYCHINAEDSDVTAKGEPYEDAYTTRTLENGRHPNDATQTLEWGEFVVGSEIYAQKSHTHKISEVKELQTELDNKVSSSTYNEDKKQSDTKINDLQKAVASPAVTFIKGMIMMWSGVPSTIPQGWQLCDGSNGTPDLRNRFVVGSVAKENGIDFYAGYTGGKEYNIAKITLTYKDIPAHQHLFIGDSNVGNANTLRRAGNGEGTWSGSGGGAGYKWLTGGNVYKDSSDAFDKNLYNSADSCVVTSEPMNICPPYYCLAFIMYTGV